jgi:hypothetical protein
MVTGVDSDTMATSEATTTTTRDRSGTNESQYQANNRQYRGPVSNPQGPASPRQISGLKNFGAQIPPQGITRAQASDWMSWLVDKAKSGAPITEDDLSGPPSIRPVIDYSHRTPEKAPPPARDPLPPPEPVPAETGPVSPPEAAPESDFLPTSDCWSTAEAEMVLNAEGELVSTRLFVRVSGHPGPGESWSEVSARFARIAQAEVAKAAAHQ